ncbi:hypothetical protein DMH17_08410 [Raoultella planticola]|nr:hypothetical protein [Raoultella planticola]
MVKQDNAHESLALSSHRRPSWRRETGAGKHPAAAIDVGARFGHTMIEFDAKLSKDGQIFCCTTTISSAPATAGASPASWPGANCWKADAGSWYSHEFKGEPRRCWPRLPNAVVSTA